MPCNWERVRAAGTKLLCKPAGDYRTTLLTRSSPVAFKVYDVDRDGYISNGELFLVLKMMVGNNLKEQQLQQIVDKTIMEADKDGDGKLSFEEFALMVSNTVRVTVFDVVPGLCTPNAPARFGEP